MKSEKLAVTHQIIALTPTEMCYAAAHSQHAFTACF